MMPEEQPIFNNQILDTSLNQPVSNLLDPFQKDYTEFSSHQMMHLAGETLIDAWENQGDAKQALVYAAASIFNSNFISNAEIAFGESFDVQKAQALGDDILTGKSGVFPDVEFLSNAEMKGALGAYAESTNTIYLNSDFLTDNAENPSAIGKVLVEEKGHFIDAYANPVDSDGDEGEILAGLVAGDNFTANELQSLKLEDDSTTLIIDGQELTVEQSFGNNLKLDGVDDYLSISIDTPETEVTHEFRFKTTDTNAGLFSVVDGDLGVGGHDRHIYLEGGNVKTRIWNKEIIQSTGLNLADGKWHHVAYVIGASVGGQKLYVDGQLVASGNKVSSNFKWQKRINIGFSNDAQNKFLNGEIDDVRIWDTTRSQSEIQSSMAQELAGNETGLIGYWKLNETTGDVAADSTGAKRDGELRNNPTWVTNPDVNTNAGTNTSNFNSNLKLDGVDDYLSISIDTPETEVTHEFRFKTTDTNAGLFSVVDGDLGVGGHDRHIYLEGGNLKTRIWNKEIIQSTGLNLADGKWHHVAYVIGASVGGQKLYVDGQLVASGNKVSSNFNWQKRINLGFSRDAQNKFLNGELDDVRIWDKTRSQFEIQSSMGQELVGNETGLIGYWKLNETTGNVAVDSSSAKENGELRNNPTWVTTETNSDVNTNPGTNTSNFNNNLKLDGVDDYLSISIDTPETEVTHEFRFKTTDTNAGLFSVVDGDLGVGGHDRHIYLEGGNVKTRIWNKEIIQSTGLNLADGKWHHVAYVIGASVGGQKLYVDGQLVASGNKVSSNFKWQKRINLGFSKDARNKFLNGELDDVRIWDKTRSQSEIQSSIGQELVGNETGLIGYWKLNETTGNVAVDSTSAKRNGELRNNPTWVTNPTKETHVNILPNRYKQEILLGNKVDFDGDGRTDFLRQEKGHFANDAERMLETYLSNGDGSFRNAWVSEEAAKGFHGDMTNLFMGDFNGDGKTDFLRQEKGDLASDEWWMFETFISNGDGSFTTQYAMHDTAMNGDLTNIFVGDFNGDGKSDFLRQEKGHFANDAARMLETYLSNGDGSFTKAWVSEEASRGFHGDMTNLFMGDFNGDGKTDFLRQKKGDFTSDQWWMFETFISNGDGSFTTQFVMHDHAMNGDLTNIFIGDFDGDGSDDFIRQEKGHFANDAERMLETYLSNGDGSFRNAWVSEEAVRGFHGDMTNLVMGDFNGDGKTDFIRQEKGDFASQPDWMFETFISNGDGSFNTQFVMHDHSKNGDLTNLFVGDFDGNGSDDFLLQEKGHFANDIYGMLQSYTSHGNGSFTKRWQADEYAMHGDLTNLFTSNAERPHQPYDNFGNPDGIVNSWKATFYNWNGQGNPIIDDNHKIGTVNLGGNIRSDGTWGMSAQNWGTGSPAPEVPIDFFAMHAYTRVDLTAGHTYKVKLRSDDGYRMWAHKLDGNPFNITENALGGTFLSDAHGGKEFTFVAPESGTFDFHAQMFEAGGDAIFDLSVTDLTAPAPPVWENPLAPGSYSITSRFGLRDLNNDGIFENHKGIDLGANTGTRIEAARSGTVTFVGTDQYGGKYIDIDHGGGLKTRYLHLSTFAVSKGDVVNDDTKIGEVGSTGLSTGPHLHFEVWENGERKNPEDYILFNVSAGSSTSNSTSSSANVSTGESIFDYSGKSYQWTKYTIQPGDSLSAIAQRTLGDANGYNFIAQRNDISNPNNINAGEVIDVPQLFNNSNPSTPTGGGSLSSSSKGLEFIGQHEGLRLNLYNDPAGHTTIGYGHLVHYGAIDGSEPEEFKQGITKERALELLAEDTANAAQAVRDLVKVSLNQAQFDALVSFTFNLGRGNLQSSDLLKRLNNGEYSAVPYELSRWKYANKVVLPGLVRRREEEGILFSNGIYTGIG